MNTSPKNVAIIGASGYTGVELIRLLKSHPMVRITDLIADRKAGLSIAEIYPHLSPYTLPDMVKIDKFDPRGVDIIFTALPHTASQAIIKTLPSETVVIDLSADFRIWNPAHYEQIYQTPHLAPELQPKAVYGLSEIYRDAIKKSNLIACPGCYPTSALLPLFPLVKARTIHTNNIIIDSKSGATGLGRSPQESALYTEVTDGFRAYSIGTHRHTPEIEQILNDANNTQDMRLSFTPHIIPTNRGILSTIYVNMSDNQTIDHLHHILSQAYEDAPFVQILPLGQTPATHHVKGSNFAKIGIVANRVAPGVIIVSAIDNLMKGASGQGIQNMNIRMGWNEDMGLDFTPIFP